MFIRIGVITHRQLLWNKQTNTIVRATDSRIGITSGFKGSYISATGVSSGVHSDGSVKNERTETLEILLVSIIAWKPISCFSSEKV